VKCSKEFFLWLSVFFVATLLGLICCTSIALADAPTGDVLDPVIEQAVAAAGIRKLEGRHLTLYTDLPADKEVDDLPRVFDLAVPAWCEYFGVQPTEVADWRMRGHLMGDRAAFRTAGLLSDDLPNFRNGYSRGSQLWWDDQQWSGQQWDSQPAIYYRRHLMLHEGTHGFMNRTYGGCGPGWYMEGMAEMLGTHRLTGDGLQLGYFPARRQDVPKLGRIRLVQKRVATSGVRSIAQIFSTNNRSHLKNEAYAWCWALAKFLDMHPRYQARFRSMPRHVTDPNFTQRFLSEFRDDWPQLCQEWRLFAGTLVHNHDLVGTAIDFQPGQPLETGTARCQIETNRGWQSSRVTLLAGKTYSLRASGRYQLAQTPAIWWCEPGGVTIRYHRGSPIGLLQAAIVPEPTNQTPKPSPLLSPIDVGTAAKISPAVSGTLYLRVNDSPGELADNRGQVEVTISAN